MAETWRPGGTIIEHDGEKLMKIDGIRVVNKRPVKAVVYYRLSDLE